MLMVPRRHLAVPCWAPASVIALLIIGALGSRPAGRASFVAPSIDVPGCHCQPGMLSRCDLQACIFRTPYVDHVARDAPLCDAVNASPTFQRMYGADANLIWPGPYYRSDFLPKAVSSGTCSAEYERQASCAPRNNWTGDYALRTGPVSPRACSMATFPLAGGQTMLRVAVACLSHFDRNITRGSDDRLVIYVAPGGSGGDLCGADEAAGHTPALTSSDWIEPRSGRRYMCHDFTEGGRHYNLFTMSLGNRPCDGPPPEAVAPGDQKSSARAAAALPGYLFRGLAAAAPAASVLAGLC